MTTANGDNAKLSGTRWKFMLAYAKAISTTSYEKITIKEVCATAALNRSTFYRYYESLDAIEHDIEDYVIARFSFFFENASSDDFLCGRKEFLQAVNKSLIEEADLLSLLLVADLSARFIDRINKLLLERLKEKYYGAHMLSNDESDIILTFIIAGRTAVYRRWMSNGFNTDFDDMATIVEKLALTGLESFKTEHF